MGRTKAEGRPSSASKMLVDGLTAAIGSAIVMQIGHNLGILWDDFVKSMGIVGKTDMDTGENTKIKSS